MRYTKESFTQELQKRFPNNQFKIIDFSGTFNPITYQCLKCGKIITKTRASHLYENKSLCQHCDSTRDSKMRNWITKFFNNNKQFQLIEWSGNAADRLYIHCNKCDRNFYKQPNNLYQRSIHTICPFCGDNGAPVLQEDFEKMMKQNGYLDYTILKYKAIGQSVLLRHSCGYVFSQKGVNFLKSKGCPKCYKTKSKGEIKIENFLLIHHITYKMNYLIKELNNLSYDFYLPDYNIFIEYQGQQHYFPVNYFGGEKHFIIQQEHDRIKAEYAKNNNIELIIIPYTEYSNIEAYLLPLLGSTTNCNLK